VFLKLSQKRGLIAPGRGVRCVATKVVRIPEDALIELDLIVDAYVALMAQNPHSPRYYFLRKFLSEFSDAIAPL